MDAKNDTLNGERWKVPSALEPLISIPHWVVWRFQTRKGKRTKVPFQPNGSHAKANDPATWSDFVTASRAAPNFDGVGFVLLNSGLAAFDIDHCRDKETGVIHPWALALVEKTASYAEITPSGTGLRIIGYGDGPQLHRKFKVTDEVECELYRHPERYITVSGDVFRDVPLAPIDEHIDFVLAELDTKPNAEAQGRPATRSHGKRGLPRELRHMLLSTGDKPLDYPSRSELLFAFLCEALRRGLDEETIIALCLDESYRGRSIFEHISDNGGRRYLEAQIEKALNRERDASGKVLIRVTTNNLDQAWRQTQDALIRANCPVFVRGGSLVQPLWRFEKSADGNRDTLVASLTKFNVARMRDVVGHHAATFLKPDQRHKEKSKAVDPPREVIEALLEAGHWSFPSVKGIINSPTLRPDGSLLVEPGYDPATQLWYKSAGDIELPPIPERPTKADAERALKIFTELLEGFPFASDVDKSVALAAILTTVLRGAFEVAPMFFISAPEAGTGKSYLVKVISAIATGREAVPLAGTRNTEEMEKRLSAAAFEASPILSLNNLDHDLDSGLLCQMLTEGKIKIRLFGRNDETRECDCRGTTVLANGNNIRIVGDLVRRTLTCRLDAKLEAPEKREFKFDPVELIKANRGAYLASAFTIARAYMAAGSPPQDKAASIAGFSDWRRFVQLPLVWLGQTDPVKSMEDARAMDPNRSALADRMAALVDSIGAGAVFTAADVFNKTMDRTKLDSSGRPTLRYPALIEVFSRDGRTVSAKLIGNQLVKDLGRVSIGHKIELAKHDPKSSHRYRIVASEEPKRGGTGPVAPSEEPDAAAPTTPNEGVKNDDWF